MTIRSLVRSICCAVMLAIAHGASAVPITSYRTTLGDGSGNLVTGTVTATLALWHGPFAGGGAASLVREFDAGIGNDFTVFVPRANVSGAWEAVIPPGAGFFDFDRALPGLSVVAVRPIGVSDVDSLNQWCAPSGGFVNGVFAMAARGTCGFAEKVSNIEAANGVGALIVDTAPGGAQAFSLGLVTPNIPVIFMSRDAGAFFLPRFVDGDSVLPYVSFSARWDPDPVAVPEPATLSLLLSGFVSLLASRRRR
jgi:hypothetical protein